MIPNETRLDCADSLQALRRFVDVLRFLFASVSSDCWLGAGFVAQFDSLTVAFGSITVSRVDVGIVGKSPVHCSLL